MSLRVFADGDRKLPVGEQWSSGTQLELDEDETRYLARVRRARVDDEVEVFGPGERWRCRILELPQKRGPARLELLDPIPTPARGPARHLLLGLPDRPAALDAIGVATALDVDEIHLIRCLRTPHGPPNPARIESVIRATRRQSGRVDSPRVRNIGSLAEALVRVADVPEIELVYGASEALFTPTLASPERPPPLDLRLRPLGLAIGPEGGFAPEELALLAERGARPLTLGTWILRSELAVAAGLGHLMAGPRAR